MVGTDKKYIIFAGVNGVGKSTLYYLHPELQSVARINMDEIASKLGSWKDLSVVMRAGKEAINDIRNVSIDESQWGVAAGELL